MENPSAMIKIRRFVICCERLTAIMVADKSCGLLLGFFEHLLIAPSRNKPARFDLPAGLDAKRGPRARKAGDLPSTRRKGVIRVAKG
jgi:hypothetical protein